MMHFSHRIDCVDAHTGGEPLRIITSGFPTIKGKTILEKREYLLNNLDHLRKMIMLEPRGHNDQYGCILVEPTTEDGDFGVLFTHNEGLSSMCGHGIIAATKTLIEIGQLKVVDGENTFKIDSPAGRIVAYADVDNGEVQRVRFRNVPCFMYRENITVDVDGIGPITADVVYGGAFYVYVDVTKVNLELVTDNTVELVRIGEEIKHKVMAEMTFDHPTSGVNWLYGTIFYQPVERDGKNIHTKNLCIFADGQVDRSPTGTGTGGRVALHHHRGEMKADDKMINLSIIDTPMEARIVEETMEGDYPAVITEVSGTAYITGFNQLVLDPKDPLAEGFRVIK